MKRPFMQIGLGIAVGTGLGAAVALLLGSGGFWLAIGIVVGIALGAAMSRTGSFRANDQQPALSRTAKGLTTND